MDNELISIFGVKFRDLEPLDIPKDELKSKYEELHWSTMENGDKDFTKDQLRKWFVDNYKKLEEFYNQI